MIKLKDIRDYSPFYKWLICDEKNEIVVKDEKDLIDLYRQIQQMIIDKVIKEYDPGKER